jgi:hypothetical protein
LGHEDDALLQLDVLDPLDGEDVYPDAWDLLCCGGVNCVNFSVYAE